MWGNKGVTIADATKSTEPFPPHKVPSEVILLKAQLQQSKNVEAKLRNLISRHNTIVITEYDRFDYYMGLEYSFERYVEKIEKERAESLAMAELTGRVEKILIDKGLLPKPKEKK